MPSHHEANTIPAVRVTQWLDEWKGIDTNAGKHRRRPEPHFYLFSISASKLKALSGVYRRKLEKNAPRSQDLGIQRAYEKDRSDEIREFIRYGWPWSELSASKRRSQDYIHLQKPGWLPTAIVVNILTPRDERHAGSKVHTDDMITVDSDGARPSIVLPKTFDGSLDWSAKGLPPIEIIDGQHRLLAFEGFDESAEYELPVVAFCGLDLSWQAYLFWTINIKPKRINASFAFDLYPLLRTEDWLEHFEGPSVYREARAQELTEALWAHPKMPMA